MPLVGSRFLRALSGITNHKAIDFDRSDRTSCIDNLNSNTTTSKTSDSLVPYTYLKSDKAYLEKLVPNIKTTSSLVD